jgi:hypothetical protein
VTEPTLFPVEPVEPTLTERQEYVLDELRRQEDGLDADEVGALLCERNGRHDRGVRCPYDSSNGQGVLKALRKKGLARRRRGGTWVALRAGEPQVGADADGGPDFGSAPTEPSPAQSAPEGPGDFPEGF